jgi:acyl-CoA thioesterase I
MGNARVKRWKIAVLVVLTLATAFVAGAALFWKHAPAESTELLAKAEQNSVQVRKGIDDANAAYEASLREAVKFPLDRPLKVLFAGDSLTAGYFSSTEGKGFSQLVVSELQKQGPVERLGGARAGGNLSTVGNLVSIPAGFDLAVIELGTNDIQGKTDPAVFPGQYEDLLNKVTIASPSTALICMGTWGSAGADTDAYDAAIQKRCEAHGGKYIDLSSEFTQSTNRGPAGVNVWAGTSDTFHPNDAGHARLAALVMDHLAVS